ncbi:Putative arsenite methyltransferase [uncultured archaeon]|nr:Putative arsenite methyltransferase [uncultured archaeon]
MVRSRVKRADQGIAKEALTRAYDSSLCCLKDKSWLQTESLLKSRIDLGCALEIGPGPGYEGLEWLRRTEDTTLKGLDVSEDMVILAREKVNDYGLDGRAEYYVGDAARIPFRDGHFDAVFSTNSLHGWADPKGVFDEIYRVLRPGGKYFVSDLRRDMNPLVRWLILLRMTGQSWVMRQDFINSFNASYTVPEVRAILAGTGLLGCKTGQTPFYVVISGRKEYP